ncbi:MAG: O-antigen ligase family protein [bacterium]|nr:O-antigen ligase family protein [bacterium]
MVVSLFLLAVISFIVFYFFLGKTELFLQILPLLGFAIILIFFMVPQKNTSYLAFFCLTASVPFASCAVYVLGGQGIQWAHLFGMVLIVHLIVNAFLGRRIVFASATAWLIAFLGVSMISTISIVQLPDYHVTEFWKSEVQLLLNFTIFVAVTNVKIETRHLNNILKLMIIISVFVGLYGIYQLPARFFGLPGGLISITNPTMAPAVARLDLFNVFSRAASIFSEPSFFGHYMVTMLALSLTAWLHNPRYFGRKWVLYTFITIQVISLVFSRSVGAYFAFVLLIMMMLIFEKGIQRYKIWGAIIWVFVIGFFVTLLMQFVSGYPFIADILARINGIYRYLIFGDPNFTVAGESLLNRLETFKIGYKIWLDHPLLGVGLGQYTLVSQNYGNPYPRAFSDSTLISTLSETGLLGVVCLLGIAISSLTGLRWAFRKSKTISADSGDPDMFKLCGRMIFYLVLIEMIYFHMLGSLFWVSTWFHLGLGGLAAITWAKYSSKAADRN